MCEAFSIEAMHGFPPAEGKHCISFYIFGQNLTKCVDLVYGRGVNGE